MSRYLSLLGLLFLGIGAVALANSVRDSGAEPEALPGDKSGRTVKGRLALPSVPSFHARFSLN
jgi:hypothetical protein